MLRGASAPAHHNEAKETAAEEDQGSWFRDGLPNSPPRPLAATYHDEAKETGAEKRYGGWFGRDQRVVVAMQHTAKGKAKIVKQCSLPFTSLRPVDLVVTELAVIAFPGGRSSRDCWDETSSRRFEEDCCGAGSLYLSRR